MSERLLFVVIKGCTQEELQNSIEVCMNVAEGHVLWNSDEHVGDFLGIRSIDDVHTCVSHSGRGYGILFDAAIRLGCVELHARIQEGNHWDYRVKQGGEVLDQFSTNPSYWGDTVDKSLCSGQPALLASLFNVSMERIEKYLVDWGDAGIEVVDDPLFSWNTVMIDQQTNEVTTIKGKLKQNFRMKGKAYPDDQFEYGDIWQVYDFIRSLGGDEPPTWRSGDFLGDPPAPGSRHNLVFPNPPDDGYYLPQSGVMARLLRKIMSWFR